MKIAKYSAPLILGLFLLLSLPSSSQSTYKKLPKDLKKEKIVFLRLRPYNESSTAFDYFKKPHVIANQRGMINNAIIKGNTRLEEASKRYPYDFTIADRGELEALQQKGYKYVLDCSFFEAVDAGKSFWSKSRPDIEMNDGTIRQTVSMYTSDVFVINLATGEKYLLKKGMSQSQISQYHKLIKSLIKGIK